jgi:dTDP-6-deoxy-L-talose 4-dehydrogenase (NAD+)
LELKVLLIGSTGFIGKQIHIEMLRQKWQVVELNRGFSGGSGFLDSDQIRALLNNEKFDCIISTAWITSHDTYRKSEENWNFATATESLAFEARRCETPIFVALGSSAEYGANNLEASSINSVLIPVDQYSSSKINTFNALTNIFKNSNTRFIWPRIFQPYGRGQDPNRFMPYLISSFAKQTSPNIKNPYDKYDWINVTDIAKAIIFSINNLISGAVDVGTGIGTANIDLANSILRNMGSNETFRPSISNVEIRGLVMSNQSRLFDYGCSPTIELDFGIRDLIASKL